MLELSVKESKEVLSDAMSGNIMDGLCEQNGLAFITFLCL